MKTFTSPDRTLGATIVARHAGEMINENAYNHTRLTPTIQWLLRRWLTW